MERTADTIWDVVARWSEEHPPTIQPGSSADGDRNRCPSWDPFTAAWDAWQGAVDHLEALGDLVERSRTLYTFAPWSLLRVAIENAALAIWLLQPEDTDDRLQRRLRVAWGDWGDAATAERCLGRHEDGWGADHRNRIKETGRQLDLDLSFICGKSSWVGVVREAATIGQIATPESTEMMWRLCSGFAHAREWSRIAWLDLEVSSPDPAGRVDVAMNSNRDRLYDVLFVAFDLATEARRQLDRRRLAWR